jgi:hypothetical protein
MTCRGLDLDKACLFSATLWVVVGLERRESRGEGIRKWAFVQASTRDRYSGRWGETWDLWRDSDMIPMKIPYTITSTSSSLRI